MEEVVTAGKLCQVCSRKISVKAKYCRYCGATQYDHEEVLQERNAKKWLTVTAIFYGISLVVCTVANFVNYFHGLEWLVITDIVLGLITLLFLAIIWEDTRHLFKWKTFTVPKLLAYSITSILLALLINLVVGWLNKYIFEEDVYFYYFFGHLEYPRLVMILMIALLPALFEEIAYRAVILQGLLNVLDAKQAIFISAFLFAVIHMSFISFFWLLPFAIWLGNIRCKEDTLWYGIVMHFCFNATACALEFYELKLY